MKKRILVIFDIDGTLLFSNKIDSRLFAKVFERRYRKPFPSIDWEYFPHVTDHTIFTTAYQEIHDQVPNQEEIDSFTDEFVAEIELARINSPEEFQAVPGVLSMFETLNKTSGYEVAIATGGWQKPAKVKLAHVGLLQDDLVISAADQQPTREDIIKTAIQRAEEMAYQWERIVYIGDALWDVRTCRNMQLPLIGLRRKGDHDVLLAAGTTHVYSDYLDKESFMQDLHLAGVPLEK